jgi:hypothetical protein
MSAYIKRIEEEIQDGDGDRAADLMSSWPRDTAKKLKTDLTEVCRAAALFCQALHPLGCARPQPCARPTHCGILTPQPHWPPASGPTQCWNTCPSVPYPGPLRSPPPVCARPQPGAGPIACQDASPLLQAHHPSGPAEPQLGRTIGPPLLGFPVPMKPCLAAAPCGKLEPHPSGTGISLALDSHIHQPARNPAAGAEPAPALQLSQISTPPGSCSGCH